MSKPLKSLALFFALFFTVGALAQRSWSPERKAPERRDPANSPVTSPLKIFLLAISAGLYFLSGGTSLRHRGRLGRHRLSGLFASKHDLPTDIFERDHQRKVNETLGIGDPTDPYRKNKTPPGKRRAG